jgi:hypothetical protein
MTRLSIAVCRISININILALLNGILRAVSEGSGSADMTSNAHPSAIESKAKVQSMYIQTFTYKSLLSASMSTTKPFLGTFFTAANLNYKV